MIVGSIIMACSAVFAPVMLPSRIMAPVEGEAQPDLVTAPAAGD